MNQSDASHLEAQRLEAERPRLVSIATRILGSSADAEDVVQTAWLRLSSTEGVEDPPAWLTTVVTRLCLDQLRRQGSSARAEDAAFRIEGNASPPDPETDALEADQIGSAMQIVLDTLGPSERAAFVLHDVFGYPFDEISTVLGRSGTAVRQLASRARRKVQGAPETASEVAARSENRKVIEAFLKASRDGDMTTLLTLLAPDAFMQVDNAGQKMGAPPLFEGAEAVAGRFNGAKGAAPIIIDGELAAAWVTGTTVRVAFMFHLADGLVSEVELVADPEVLATMNTEPA